MDKKKLKIKERADRVKSRLGGTTTTTSKRVKPRLRIIPGGNPLRGKYKLKVKVDF